MDKLTNAMGCSLAPLINTLSILMCSSTNNGKTFHSAVHFPTEAVISQVDNELKLQSIKNPQVVEGLVQALSLLKTAVQSDTLTGSRPNSQDGLSVANIEQLVSSKDELVSNFEKKEMKQRQVVEMVSSQQNGVEPVLERPPLEQESRKKRAAPADNFLNDMQSPASPECALTKIKTTLCSPTDVSTAIDNLVKIFATAFAKLEQARLALLNDIVQSQGSSAPGSTGNLLAWASLGTSERALLGIFSKVLDVKKIAQEEQDKVNEEPLQHLNDMAAILAGFPSLLGDSMGQVSSAAGGMGELAKPVSNQKRGGMFSFFGK